MRPSNAIVCIIFLRPRNRATKKPVVVPTFPALIEPLHGPASSGGNAKPNLEPKRASC